MWPAMLLVSCVLNTPTLQSAVEETTSIVYFDLKEALATMPNDSVLHYDTLKTVSALQGLVNRSGPRLIIRFLDGESASGPVNLDDYWMEKLKTRWLREHQIIPSHSLKDLLVLFSDTYAGWVVWDPEVLATSNVASTICGVEGLLPIRKESPLLAWLHEQGFEVAVTKSLAGMFDGRETGSAKCDAYLWAKRTYLDTGKCNPALMAFFIDAYTQRPEMPGFHYPDLPNTKVANHDYYISRKAFFFDLLVWPDEQPVDDPNQPLGTDHTTLVALLKSQYDNNQGKTFTSIGGFVSWDLKYTEHGPAGGKRHPVHSEWEYISLFSTYNAILDADALGLACLPNASAWCHYPLREQYTQHEHPTPPPLENKTYVLIYMGDYDSGAWLSRNIPRVWDDPNRGEFPIAWAFNPNLSDRVPYVFDYIYETASKNDWFIAGDSGAGYLNPNLLIGSRGNSGLPEALDLWVEHNQRYFNKFDYSITGFVINGFHGVMPLRVQEAYTRFSPDGVGMQLGFEKPLVGNTPFLRHASDIYPRGDDIPFTAAEMARFARKRKPQFLIFRWILQTPTTMKQVMEALHQQHEEHQWEFCDPYTFFALYREHLRE